MQERIEYLKEQNGKFIGWVLNKVSDPDKMKVDKPKKSKKTVLLIKKKINNYDYNDFIRYFHCYTNINRI